jgi:hypothetical protein
MVAGPLFIVVALIQAFIRRGFDLGRHPISLLPLGDLGWIQIANFVISGLLAVGFAVAIRRVLHPGRAGTWGPVLVGAFGAGLITAGILVADPSLGFRRALPTRSPPTPAGTPRGTGSASPWRSCR